MTELFIIRNNAQRDNVTLFIRETKLPFKIVVQDIRPQRSLDLNEYYWGVVVKMISDYTGNSIIGTHRDLSNMFRFSYSMLDASIGPKSTTTDNNKEFMEYIDKCCAFALEYFNICIPLPNEVIYNDNHLL